MYPEVAQLEAGIPISGRRDMRFDRIIDVTSLLLGIPNGVALRLCVGFREERGLKRVPPYIGVTVGVIRDRLINIVDFKDVSMSTVSRGGFEFESIMRWKDVSVDLEKLRHFILDNAPPLSCS